MKIKLYIENNPTEVFIDPPVFIKTPKGKAVYDGYGNKLESIPFNYIKFLFGKEVCRKLYSNRIVEIVV